MRFQGVICEKKGKTRGGDIGRPFLESKFDIEFNELLIPSLYPSMCVLSFMQKSYDDNIKVKDDIHDVYFFLHLYRFFVCQREACFFLPFIL